MKPRASNRFKQLPNWRQRKRHDVYAPRRVYNRESRETLPKMVKKWCESNHGILKVTMLMHHVLNLISGLN